MTRIEDGALVRLPFNCALQYAARQESEPTDGAQGTSGRSPAGWKELWT